MATLIKHIRTVLYNNDTFFSGIIRNKIVCVCACNFFIGYGNDGDGVELQSTPSFKSNKEMTNK